MSITTDYAVHVSNGNAWRKFYVRHDSANAAIDHTWEILERENAPTAVLFECDGWREIRCVAVVDEEHGVYQELSADVVDA